MKLTHDSRSAMSRARFFVEIAAAQPPEARVEFEAYLEAAIVFARAAVHRFKATHGRHPSWQAWWASVASDPAVEFFRAERDWLLKEASLRVGQRIFVPSIGAPDGDGGAYVPARAAEFYFFDDPETSATDTVVTHLRSLEITLAAAASRFS